MPLCIYSRSLGTKGTFTTGKKKKKSEVLGLTSSVVHIGFILLLPEQKNVNSIQQMFLMLTDM